jgi:hypothetical protein
MTTAFSSAALNTLETIRNTAECQANIRARNVKEMTRHGKQGN